MSLRATDRVRFDMPINYYYFVSSSSVYGRAYLLRAPQNKFTKHNNTSNKNGGAKVAKISKCCHFEKSAISLESFKRSRGVYMKFEINLIELILDYLQGISLLPGHLAFHL